MSGYLAFAFRKRNLKSLDLISIKKKLNPWIKANLFYLIFQIPILKDEFKKWFFLNNRFFEIKRSRCNYYLCSNPLSKFKKPDLEPVYQTGKTVSKYLKKGQIVVLESSTYPGTTNPELKNILERSGLLSGEDFYLAYSPEREDPGNKNFSTSIIPKIVGADDSKTTKLVYELYKQVISKVVEVSSTQVAEAKAYRKYI